MGEGIAMRLTGSLLVAAILLPASVAWAAPEKGAPLPSEIRLTDQEKEKVLEEAAAGRRQPAPLAADGLAEEENPLPKIHGEVGVSIGTGGYRSAYGTAVVPLKNDGVAIISVGSTDFGSRPRYLAPWWE